MMTGENEQGLRKILDMTRMMSIAILLLHFYYCCYKVFEQWQLTATLTSRLIQNIYNTGLFNNFHRSKLIALGLLVISIVGAKGRKDEKLNYQIAFAYLLTGLVFYFASGMILFVQSMENETIAILY